MASMLNTKDMSVLVRKKGLAITFSGSNEAQYNDDDHDHDNNKDGKEDDKTDNKDKDNQN